MSLKGINDMRTLQRALPRPPTLIPERTLAEQVFSRAAGAPLVGGNDIRLLVNAQENYPTWMKSIESARETIHFEMYFIREDDAGRRFAEMLAAKAREGVHVRLLYDWMGQLFKTSGRFWKRLRHAGVEVRCFNPPRLDSPLGWLSRDHRKVIVVDGRVAFVTGLCIGQEWTGNSRKSIDPWRDTGVEIRGPAVADIEEAFAEVWTAAGGSIPLEKIPRRESMELAGDVALRVIATVPHSTGVYRIDNLVASLARRSLWLSDAYFVGVSSYVQALRSAALDGVDVRLLVPGSTDIPVLGPLSRTGYQPLLEAGVRVFEWNGAMMHAKTAVADGVWARVGSTNLNLASWMGNYELDVAVEDKNFARSMEEMFLRDLENSTEVILRRPNRVGLATSQARTDKNHRKIGKRKASRTGRGPIRFGYSVGAVLREHRFFNQGETKITASAALLLFLIATAGILWPMIITVPIAFICGWFSLSLFVRAVRLYVRSKSEGDGT